MKVFLMFADAAQAVGGKLYVLGGGWSWIAVGFPFAIAMTIDVPWSQATDTHRFRLELVDADGEPVVGESPDGGSSPVRVEGEFCTGIPAQVKPGESIAIAQAFTFPPLPLEPNRRYQFRLTIDGRADEDWTLAFNTKPHPLAQAA